MRMIFAAARPTSCVGFISTTVRFTFCSLALASALAPPAAATDIFGVQDAALDQPRINALLRPENGGTPLGDPDFNTQAFFDTGASGVILSNETADLLGVQRTGTLFEDVGIGGSSRFDVSQRLRVDLAPFTNFNDPTDVTQYTQHFGPLRTQIGPLGNANPLLENTDVFGMPTMQGKVVVMDPKPLNDISRLMQTYVYNPGTPFSPTTAGFDPGIPHTSRSVALTFASFSRFTKLTPSNAEGPTQGANPFIGPNPLTKIDSSIPAGDVPGITAKLGSKEVTGSFLLDTGAAASVISKDLAAKLGVRERAGGATGDPPLLEQFDPAHPELPGTELPNQFVLTLSGTGGDQTAAGFFLDSLLIRTKEGDPSNENDPRHIRYIGAPVLVSDVSLVDQITGRALTLDGLFAMNFLAASVFLSEPFELGEINAAPFDWIVFDPQNSVLGLELSVVPEPSTYAIMLLGLALVGWRLRRARRAEARLQPEVGLVQLFERAQRRLRQRSERLPRQRLLEVRELR